MAQVGVYHMTTKGFRDYMLDLCGRMDEAKASENVMEGIQNKCYVLCAQVDAKSLEEAYHLTQNLTEEGWAAGPHVVFAAQHRQRSSMVGDLMMFDGDAYVVASFGFTKLHPRVARELSSFGFDGRTGTAFD